jgi:2-polyprenyl-3-methyl-5-hydroxy-6-metoxy-1,4-benzoquinol methylase/uncharacterized protein YbaR (Trm112 family)
LRLRLLDILACPCDGASPLELIPLSVEKRSARNAECSIPCSYFCAAQHGGMSASSAASLCANCLEQDLVEGILVCPSCRRWFSVLGGIPILVRDGLRREKEEIALLARHSARLPEEITHRGNPINLVRTHIERSEHDQDILEEGEYWGEFFAAHEDVGDTSILDIRQRGTHPSYYPYGILERDERDFQRACGMFPDHLGRLIFGAMKRFRAGRALDIGCGGGQFALEATYQGLEAVGMDISLRCLEIARRYATSLRVDVHYVCAEPMNPPFRRETFDLLLSKDTLHHLADPEGALARLEALLKPEGAILVYEHVGKSRLVRWILERFNSVLVPKILRRYEHVDVPEVLQSGSAHEDIGMKKVVPALRKLFMPEFQRGELMLYFEVEQLLYYAFGKREWFSRPVRGLFFALERVLLLFVPPEHVTMLARKRGR